MAKIMKYPSERNMDCYDTVTHWLAMQYPATDFTVYVDPMTLIVTISWKSTPGAPSETSVKNLFNQLRHGSVWADFQGEDNPLTGYMFVYNLTSAAKV